MRFLKNSRIDNAWRSFSLVFDFRRSARAVFSFSAIQQRRWRRWRVRIRVRQTMSTTTTTTFPTPAAVSNPNFGPWQRLPAHVYTRGNPTSAVSLAETFSGKLHPDQYVRAYVLVTLPRRPKRLWLMGFPRRRGTSPPLHVSRPRVPSTHSTTLSLFISLSFPLSLSLSLSDPIHIPSSLFRSARLLLTFAYSSFFCLFLSRISSSYFSSIPFTHRSLENATRL